MYLESVNLHSKLVAVFISAIGCIPFKLEAICFI